MIFSDEQILQWVLLMRIQGEVECTYIMVQLQSLVKNQRFVEGVACINFIFFFILFIRLLHWSLGSCLDCIKNTFYN